MPAKYQYFDYVKKECKQVMEKFFKKTSVIKVAKKGLKQPVASNTMHFYNPISLWCAHLGDPTENSTCNKMNGYTTCRWNVLRLFSYTSKWSRDVEIDCVWHSSLFQSFFLSTLLTLVLFYIKFFSPFLAILLALDDIEGHCYIL